MCYKALMRGDDFLKDARLETLLEKWPEVARLKSHDSRACPCQVFFLPLLRFFFFPVGSFRLNQAASVATLPSALFVERLSLGASWVYSIQ
jgi:hypothetical protein